MKKLLRTRPIKLGPLLRLKIIIMLNDEMQIRGNCRSERWICQTNRWLLEKRLWPACRPAEMNESLTPWLIAFLSTRSMDGVGSDRVSQLRERRFILGQKNREDENDGEEEVEGFDRILFLSLLFRMNHFDMGMTRIYFFNLLFFFSRHWMAQIPFKK